MAGNPSRPWRTPMVWGLIGVLVLVSGVSVAIVRNLLQTRQIAAEQAALPPPQQVHVAALGRIEPVGRVVDVVASENGRLDKLQVAEGDQVKSGQVLAYLDIYNTRKAQRDYAASQLAEAKAQLQAETALGQAQIQEASTRLQQIDQPQSSAVAAQAAAIQSLQAELNVAEIDLRRFQQLNDQGAISRQELDRQQATVNRLRADLDKARATKQQLEQTRTGDLSNANAQLASAQANVRLAQIQSRVDSASQNLALAESQLELAVIRAPRDGQVLRLYAEPGEAVSLQGEPILSLGDTRQMYVVAEVYETDIGLVKVGQPATITSRNGAFAQTLTGTVEEVGLSIAKNDVLDDDPAANADARVVEVRIKVDQSDVVAALTNLQVDVAIDIDP